MVFEVANNIVNPIAAPLLGLPPLLAIGTIGFVLSFLITIVYKYATNQKVLKQIREDMKSIQQELKASRGDQAKASELNKRLLQKTGEQMKQSMRSFIFTLVPVLLIFSWMQGHVVYESITPNQDFTTTAWFEDGASGNITLQAKGLTLLSPATQQPADDKIIWKLKGDAGNYELEYSYQNEFYQRQLIITNQWAYKDQSLEKGNSIFGINLGDKVPIRKESDIKKITTDHRPQHPMGSFRLFGWQPGWLMTYIMFTLVFTFPLRKLLKVH